MPGVNAVIFDKTLMPGESFKSGTKQLCFAATRANWLCASAVQVLAKAGRCKCVFAASLNNLPRVRVRVGARVG